MKLIVCLFLALGIFKSNKVFCQEVIPGEIKRVINLTAKNKNELLKAAKYYQQKKEDSLKLKAMYFLLKNMDIHHSENYYWADAENKRIDFNELNYLDFSTATKAFDSLKKSKGNLHPVIHIYKDIDTITAQFLVNNIENAFKVWKLPIAAKIKFDDFCEYLLPYRISVEPLQDWRKTYQQKFKWFYDSVKNNQVVNVVSFLMKDINRWFTCTWNMEKRTEPLPRLGANQVLLRKKGLCEDAADLAVWALRSQGICASTDLIPYWATSSGGHTLNYIQTENNEKKHFDILFKELDEFKLIREPGKVFRQTFSKQKNALASLTDTNSIPKCILRQKNIIDVTTEYWKTTNVVVDLFDNKDNPPKIVFAYTLNYSQWKPTWWSKTENGKATFTNMCKGVVYLPAYYKDGKISYAGNPIAVGYNHTQILNADTINRRSVVIKNREHYLNILPNTKYRLFFWNNKWSFVGTYITKEKEDALKFNKVPKNALFVLIPEKSKRKERPFIITDDERQVYF